MHLRLTVNHFVLSILHAHLNHNTNCKLARYAGFITLNETKNVGWKKQYCSSFPSTEQLFINLLRQGAGRRRAGGGINENISI